jgi:hypothetical protein
VSRRAATAIWAAMLVVPICFMAVASTARWGAAEPGTAALLFWVSVVVSVFTLTLAVRLPPRLGPFRAGPAATAFARLVVGWSLCEAAAFFPLIAWIVSGDARLVGESALDLCALGLLFPSDRRWASLLPPSEGPRRGRLR